ncbi:DoxX family protein [Colwellia sp. Bg11-12]|uniref:DoxX family protein n=1 Tax=Colwellia sp. Bg11-12 TaxID=2759817 RepID=UPI0015F36B3F|nr:DoxX family protein [Colwellia sp. Bg11-12]MBA6262427.1 DoxX family protein [Colwellia sp. Bg11-12]
MNTLQTFAAPTGRFFLAIMFFMSGITKISQYAGTQGYMEAMGVSGALLPLVILVEVMGGLAIILGWKTKYAAIALTGFSILSAILFHADFSNQAEMNNFMKNIAIAGGFLTLFVHGPGAFSIDNRTSKNTLN